MGGPHRSFVVGLLLGVVATTAACEVAVDPIEVPAGCPEMPLRGPEAVAADIPDDRMIDDFEDGNFQVTTVAGRGGLWTTMNNMTSTMLIAGPSTSCAARGHSAGHFAAAGFTVYGASVTAFLAAQNGGLFATPYDGSDYTGISFWAATGSSRTTAPVELGLSTMDTVSNGGVCTSLCLDYYRKAIQLTQTWQRFVLPYAELVQSGAGRPQIPMLDAHRLVGFVIWPEKQFDIWIDDIRFEP
jgi:hypothetical protein